MTTSFKQENLDYGINENKNESNFLHNNRISNKVDAATMTDPLKIDLKMTSQYLDSLSGPSVSLPFACKFDEGLDYDTYVPQGQDNSYAEEIDVKPKLVDGVLAYQCSECSFSNSDQRLFSEHFSKHKKRHFCDLCGAAFKRKEHLDRHRVGHNADRPFQCQVCFKGFKRNEHLTRHEVTHFGSKSEVCQVCNKAFYRKDHLKKHMTSHQRKPKIEGDTESPVKSDEGMSTFSHIFREVCSPQISNLRTFRRDSELQ